MFDIWTVTHIRSIVDTQFFSVSSCRLSLWQSPLFTRVTLKNLCVDMVVRVLVFIPKGVCLLLLTFKKVHNIFQFINSNEYTEHVGSCLLAFCSVHHCTVLLFGGQPCWTGALLFKGFKLGPYCSIKYTSPTLHYSGGWIQPIFLTHSADQSLFTIILQQKLLFCSTYNHLPFWWKTFSLVLTSIGIISNVSPKNIVL